MSKVTGHLKYYGTDAILKGGMQTKVAIMPTDKMDDYYDYIQSIRPTYVMGEYPYRGWAFSAPKFGGQLVKIQSDGSFIFNNVPDGDYVVGMAEPYTMKPTFSWMNRFLPPQEFWWKGITDEHLAKMYEWLGEGDFSDLFMSRVIGMHNPCDTSDQVAYWVGKWEYWKSNNNYPNYCYNYLPMETFVTIDGEASVEADAYGVMKGDVLHNQIG